jgi:hypothetical protein
MERIVTLVSYISASIKQGNKMAQILTSSTCSYRSIEVNIYLQGNLQDGAGEAWAYLLVMPPIIDAQEERFASSFLFDTEQDAYKAALDWATRFVDATLRPKF